jgi:hypothetical protein
MISDFKKVEYLQNALIAFATNDKYETSEYERFRLDIIGKPIYDKEIPEILLKYRTRDQFWPFIRSAFATYQLRRQYIYNEFANFLTFLEKKETTPSDILITSFVEELGEGYIIEEWQKAIERRNTDPKGAITMARTLLETTCKFILDKISVNYKDSMDLPELYKLTSESLNLAPSQHTEQVTKQILGGCHSIVVGIGSLRNKISDSHGQGVNKINPSARHAFLAVNAAGSLATFLLQTLDARKKNSRDVANPVKVSSG